LPSARQATNPINLYRATKLCSDKLFVAANGYDADDVIEALSKVLTAYAIGTRPAAFAAAR
jgi:hypothetical protein